MIDPRLRKDIQGAEKCVLTAYQDSKRLWTIGWGHLLDQRVEWRGVTWTQTHADGQLDADIGNAQVLAGATPEWAFLDTACRQNALSELLFNMGPKRWMGFIDTRGCMRLKDWRGTHDNLLKSEWRADVHETRANRIANYFLSGQYP